MECLSSTSSFVLVLALLSTRNILAARLIVFAIGVSPIQFKAQALFLGLILYRTHATILALGAVRDRSTQAHESRENTFIRVACPSYPSCSHYPTRPCAKHPRRLRPEFRVKVKRAC